MPVWLNISRYDSRRSFTTWLYAIVSRLCLDHLKSRAHIVAIPEDESVLRRYASADGQPSLGLRRRPAHHPPRHWQLFL